MPAGLSRWGRSRRQPDGSGRDAAERRRAVAGMRLLDVLIEGASTPWMGAVTPGGPRLLGQEPLVRWLMGGMALTGVGHLALQECFERRDDRPPHATGEGEP
jgi:hypothetical protein